MTMGVSIGGGGLRWAPDSAAAGADHTNGRHIAETNANMLIRERNRIEISLEVNHPTNG